MHCVPVRSLAVISAVPLAACVVTGCARQKSPPQALPAKVTPVAQPAPMPAKAPVKTPEAPVKTSVKTPAKVPLRTVASVAAPPPAPVPRISRFGSGKGYEDMERADAAVRPLLKPYSVKPGLANVVNRKMFQKVLLPAQVRLLERNGFAVTPTTYTQMFHVYENNQYQEGVYPSFITTDSMLHTYHLFYDYSLRTIEATKLLDAAARLTDTMLSASERDLRAASDPIVREAARRNVAYFAVARNLLKGTPVPSGVRRMANADLAKIMAHEGRAVSDIFGYKVDFSQFVPRGHYTRTPALKRYFRAMLWYGLCPLPLPEQGAAWDGTPTVQSLLIARNLRSVRAGSAPAMKLWDTVYEPTVFYVGSADDYTVYHYADIADRIYGRNPRINRFAEPAALNRFITEVRKLPGPGIENFVAVSKAVHAPDPLFPVGRQFRFMGQRFIPDSRIMQELTDPKVDGRNFPKGLDVCAAIGSDRALQILNATYRTGNFRGYTGQMAKMRQEMAATPRSTWQSNLYYGWLWSLQSLIKPATRGYPSFMRSSAWQDKSLFTALGSWTELRHDTIMYAKQSVAECGGDGERPKPKGYVEPNLEFWSRLKWLNAYTKDGLSSRGLLTPELKDKFAKLDDWLTFCRNITIKELTNRKISDEEYRRMEMYGADLEQMTISYSGGDLLSDEDKDMALVADVHTSFDRVMEEGTGRAAEIYVVVPIEGRLHLTRGAVYTQYEFEHPASDRLTDKAWQKMLQSGREPGFAGWTESFLLPKRKKAPPQFENYEGGC